jgi:hypothetical protein
MIYTGSVCDHIKQCERNRRFDTARDCGISNAPHGGLLHVFATRFNTISSMLNNPCRNYTATGDKGFYVVTPALSAVTVTITEVVQYRSCSM